MDKNFQKVELATNVEFLVDENGEYYMTSEQLGIALGYSLPRHSINRIINRSGYLQRDKFSFLAKLRAKDGKNYSTRVITKEGIFVIVSTAERPISVKNTILRLLEEDETSHYLKPYHEEEYIYFLQRAFSHLDSEREAAVGNYRVDLMFLDFNLVVECDEFNHNYYDQETELKRQKYIEDKGYRFIRFNPHDKEFCISDVVNKIILEIYENKS